VATGKDTILEGLGMAHLVASFPSRQHVNALLDFLIVAFAVFTSLARRSEESISRIRAHTFTLAMGRALGIIGI
jgi:large-conductance mechanosensitive channel